MLYLSIIFFLFVIFWAYRMLKRDNARMSDSLMIVGVVVVSGLILYAMLFANNPWHKGKRALAWGQQLQDWRSQQEVDEAAGALNEIGEPALAALSLALENKDAKVSKKAADVIADICSRSKEFDDRYRVIFKYMMLVMKESQDASVRAYLAHALARCGSAANNDAVIEGLTNAAQSDADAAVRESAAEALAEIKSF